MFENLLAFTFCVPGLIKSCFLSILLLKSCIRILIDEHIIIPEGSLNFSVCFHWHTARKGGQSPNHAVREVIRIDYLVWSPMVLPKHHVLERNGKHARVCFHKIWLIFEHLFNDFLPSREPVFFVNIYNHYHKWLAILIATIGSIILTAVFVYSIEYEKDLNNRTLLSQVSFLLQIWCFFKIKDSVTFSSIRRVLMLHLPGIWLYIHLLVWG